MFKCCFQKTYSLDSLSTISSIDDFDNIQCLNCGKSGHTMKHCIEDTSDEESLGKLIEKDNKKKKIKLY